MKYTIIVILSLFSCTNLHQEKMEIVYKLKTKTQDTIVYYMEKEALSLERTNYYFDYRFDGCMENNDIRYLRKQHVFSLKSNPDSIIQVFLNKTNRYVLIKGEKYKVISQVDFSLDRRPDERLIQPIGGRVFYLEYDTKLIEVGLEM